MYRLNIEDKIKRTRESQASKISFLFCLIMTTITRLKQRCQVFFHLPRSLQYHTDLFPAVNREGCLFKSSTVFLFLMLQYVYFTKTSYVVSYEPIFS